MYFEIIKAAKFAMFSPNLDIRFTQSVVPPPLESKHPGHMPFHTFSSKLDFPSPSSQNIIMEQCDPMSFKDNRWMENWPMRFLQHFDFSGPSLWLAYFHEEVSASKPLIGCVSRLSCKSFEYGWSWSWSRFLMTSHSKDRADTMDGLYE